MTACLTPRVHGNTRRLPPNALTFSDVQHVVAFISKFAETHAIFLPGRIPGYKRSDLQLLPTSTTRCSVWQEYTQAATTSDSSVHCVAYTMFCRLWRKLLPQVLPSKPMTDLCATCHRNSVIIMRGANLPDSQKTQVNTLYIPQEYLEALVHFHRL